MDETLRTVRIGRQNAGHVHDQDVPGEFRRLKGERPEGQPALSAANYLASHQNEDQQQQHKAHGRQRQAPLCRIWNRSRYPHRHQAQAGPHHLTLQEVQGVAITVLRHDGAGAVQHPQADRDQNEGQDDQGQVSASR